MAEDHAYLIQSQIVKANMSYQLNGYLSTINFSCKGEDPIVDIPIIIHFIPKEYVVNNLYAYAYELGYVAAIDGMTWGEWIASPLSPEEAEWDGSQLCIGTNLQDEKIFLYQQPQDFIIENYVYSTYLEECCFIAGTQVLMATGEEKPIEKIKIDEEVISYDIDTGEQYIAIVTNTIENKRSVNMATIMFSNGQTLSMTDYHPIYTASGWKSLTGHLGYAPLEVGQLAKTSDGWAEIIDIKQYQNESPISTYTLDVINKEEMHGKDDNTHDNFYANGIVVHNASCPT